MAALYLHQALFTPEPSAPPILSQMNPVISSHNDRRLSSISSATLRTASTSDYSHPTESLLDPLSPESAAYLDLLARQPNHPDSPGSPSAGALKLDGDPITPNEEKFLWERKVRRKLRRLRWTKRILLMVLSKCATSLDLLNKLTALHAGGWTIYNTIRYYVAFTIYNYRTRQIILLALGTSTVLSLVLTLVMLLVAWFSPRLGLIYRPHAPHVLLQAILTYSSSVLLLAPAIVNFIFVFIWKSSSSDIDTLRDRCHWDVDVLWSGVGARCDPGVAWGYWLAGAVLRLVLTTAFLASYHLAYYQYDITRNISRQKRRSRPKSDVSSRTATTATQSLRPLNVPSTPASPMFVPQIGRQPSISTSEGHTTVESLGSSSEHRPLRSSRSRISSQAFLASKPRETSQTPAAAALSRDKECQSPAFRRPSDEISPSSSDEDLPGELDRYGRPIRRLSSAHTPPQYPSPSRSTDDTGDGTNSSSSDSDLVDFVHRFRTLVDQVSRETEEGIALAQNDPTDAYYSASFPDDYHDYNSRYSAYMAEDAEYVPVLGRTIHRMPTIESLGSREVMSLTNSQSGSSVHRASPGPHHISRPSTRSNNLSISEAGTSTPSTRSRANSLDAALVLAPPVEEDARDERGEFGELQVPRPSCGVGKELSQGSGSSASYHSARSHLLQDKDGIGDD
ncbi:hypothetical protein WOLCODRAFT_74244 [Wolfiporia cocos MD-104 SS10]|uniref:Uncharacterized protein n=1 Tax=Wolfiporia cocos (strain MD-104) TaxID=742152 RepID=A0A2H3JLS2_WOLCO|nr:hypothetical protein WOLCODRAFT_74244 [Wolfiporia cocos MD-104 SS10]